MAGTARGERINKKSEDFFDQIAASEEIIPEPVRCYPYVLELLASEEGGSLADLGCGTGEMLSRILQTYPDRFRLHGLDLSANSLKKAEEKCGGAVSLQKGNVEQLPYETGSMDLLLCMHSFHHYPHPVEALREMRRVLKPGGKLILVENCYPTMKRLKVNITLLLYRYPNGDIRMYSQKQMNALAVKAGFELLENRTIGENSQLLTCRKQEQDV